MEVSKVCVECGGNLPSGASGTLCPRCLMGAVSSVTSDDFPAVEPKELVDFSSFARAARELELVAPAELDMTLAVASDDVTRLARLLVQQGKLTPYQAGALLQGKAKGLLIGRYLVWDRLGVGGMGVVFLAAHRPSGRIVALKILPPSFGREPKAVRRFRREFQVASRLKHPNLVAAIEASEDRGVHFLTMDYIQGKDLDRLVTERGPLPVKLALHCIIQAARGLEAAHAQGVVHRDVKPGNLMIDSAGAVRVLDLGLARVIEATSPFGQTASGTLTESGAYMGTVDFLAPEQADNAKKADQRADIYSLGCTLYFILTGQPPFPANTVLQRLMAHQHRPVPSLRELRPEVSERLDAVYQKMMEKRPARRYQLASDVILALEQCRVSPREAGDVSADLKTFAANGTTLAAAAAPIPRPIPIPASLVRVEPPPILPIQEAIRIPIATEVPSPRRRLGRDSIGLAIGALAVLVPFAYYYSFSSSARPDAEPAPVPSKRLPSPLESVAVKPPEPQPAPEQVETPGARPVDLDLGPIAGAAAEPKPDGPKEPATLPAQEIIFLSDEFDDPLSGWPRSTAEELADNAVDAHDYKDGKWYCKASDWRYHSWIPPAGLLPEFEAEIAMRIVSETPGGQGSAVVHLFAEEPGKKIDGKARAIQIRIDEDGWLFLEPSSWTAGIYPEGPWAGPIIHPAIKRGDGDFNVLNLRVWKRQIEILVNKEKVCEPIGFDWDLIPMGFNLGVVSISGRVRAEYDSIKIRKLDAAPGPISAPKGGSPGMFLGGMIYKDSFSNPASGWARGEIDMGPGAVPNKTEYENGIYYLEHNGNWHGSSPQNCTGPLSEAFQVDAVGRVLGVGPEALGAWGIILTGQEGRGFQISIDRNAMIVVDPAWQGIEKHPEDRRYLGPLRHRALKQGNVWNTLTLRARKRSLELLVNGQPIGRPILVNWDVLPTTPQISIFKPDLGTSIRAEFDSIMVRALADRP